MRYHTAGYDGDTRADRNRRVGHPVPVVKKPIHCIYLLDWFYELNRTRPYQDGRPCGLTYQEIESWKRLKRHNVQPHQIDALLQIDAAYCSELSDAIKYSDERRRREEGNDNG